MKKIASLSMCSIFVLGAAACSSLPPGSHSPRQASYALPRSDAMLGQTYPAGSFAADESAFAMLANGVDGLAARLELVEASRSSLDLQYYIFRADTSGSLIARALLRAADRGVRVRVLVDDGESVAGDERLFALAANPMVQIRVFNPLEYRGHVQAMRAVDFLFHKARLDHRMHNKLLVADNAMALVGGRNIGDQYFQIAPDSQFGDDDVAVVGPLVQQLSSTFDEFWNFSASIPVQLLEPSHTSVESLEAFRLEAQAAQAKPLDDELRKRVSQGEPLRALLSVDAPMTIAPARVVYDSPNKAPVVAGSEPGKLISARVIQKARSVQSELLMIAPYFVPSSTQLTLLTGLQEKGVQVRVLTNSLEAAPTVAAHAGYARNRIRLLGTGVELHEIRARVEGTRGTGQSKAISRYGNYALHAKLYVFDRKSLFVGSMNFDQRSENLNTEIGVLIDSPDLAVGAAKRFESLTQLRNAYRVTQRGTPLDSRKSLVWESEENGAVLELTTEPSRHRWQRLQLKLLSWLPIDGEL